MENSRALIRRIADHSTADWLEWLAAVCLASVLASSSLGAAETSTNVPVKVKVSGFGLLGNREMVRLLRNFQLNGRMPPIIDRTFVEDAALVLLARATEEGFLRATLRANFKMPDGSRRRFNWTNALEVALPLDFAARAGDFRLKPGVRFHYRAIQFEGLLAISEREAKSYFVGGDMLLKLRRNRVFSPAALRSSLAALREAYARAGYQSALVATNQVLRNESSGAVNLAVVVQEGLPTIVRTVEVEVYEDKLENPESGRTLTPNKPYSELWRQELAQELRAGQYVKGFPDATVEFSELGRQTNATSIQVDFSARVRTGARVTIFWVNGAGQHPTGGQTVVSLADVGSGKWKVNPGIVPAVGAGAYEYLQRYADHYIRKLAESGKYPLMIWPYHAMLGGIGHALVSAVEEAVFFHSVARRSAACFQIKGSHPLTEHYSVLHPEVREDHGGKPLAAQNREFIQALLDFDAVLIAGQAKSHCVAWTIDDLLSEVAARDPALARKVYLLEHCTSPVVVPGVADFTEPADKAFRRFADAGMHVVKSTTPMQQWPGRQS
jgi:nicotinamidase-related amidase